MGGHLAWFKIYAAETLSDERFSGWSVEERGAWFTLLLHAWREGSIPSDLAALARLLHVDAAAMRLLWDAIGDRFVDHPDHPGRLTSPRLEKEREAGQEMLAKKAAAGKAGATSRWDKKNRKHGNRMAGASDRNAMPMRSDGASGQVSTASAQQQQPPAAAAAEAPSIQANPRGAGAADAAAVLAGRVPQGKAAALAARYPLTAQVAKLLADEWGEAPSHPAQAKRDQVERDIARLGVEYAADLCFEEGERVVERGRDLPQSMGFFAGLLEKAQPKPKEPEKPKPPAGPRPTFEIWN